MVEGKFKLTFHGGVPGGIGVPAKRFHEIRKEVWLAAGELWHERFREKHFTRAGATEYGYTPRSGEGLSGKKFWQSYTGRKQRYKGHQRPLVFTGDTEKQAKRKKIVATSRGTKSSLRIYIRAPRLNSRNPHSKINMRDEMTRVSVLEVKRIVDLHNEQMVVRLNILPPPVTVEI
jgi:hypothetical protein